MLNLSQCMLTQDYFEGDIWFFPENTAHTVVALDDGCYFLTDARLHHIACLPCRSLEVVSSHCLTVKCGYPVHQDIHTC